jgi:hypothetical protein
MPDYLLHETADGNPVGVYTETADYYDPEFTQLRPEGRQLVFSKLPSMPWADFIEKLANTTPSRTMRWDVYNDPSSNLQVVLTHAQRDLETSGDEASVEE